MTIYVFLGGVPATYMSIFLLAFLSPDYELGVYRAFAGLLSIIALWLAAYNSPKKSIFNALICLALVLGLLSILPAFFSVLINSTITPFETFVFALPLVIASHYVGVSVVTMLKHVKSVHQ